MGGRFHQQGNSGYLVYLRRNGAIGLWNQHDGVMQEVAGAVADASEFQRVRIQMDDWRIRVWANGDLIINRLETNERFGPGYIILQVLKTDSSYDDIHIWNQPNALPELVASSLSRNWLIADDATPYEVTVSAGDPDGVDEIMDVRLTLHDGTWQAEHARGQLAWAVSDEQIASSGGQWTFMGDAVGSGRWAWRNGEWGSDVYVTPVSAATSIDGNQRNVTFTYTVKPAWAPATHQGMHAYASDLKGDSTTWLSTPSDYSVHLSGPGDLDHDNDADQADFGIFQTCYTGPGIAQTDSACIDARLDGDDDVDPDDFTVFQGCMSGANVPSDPGCAD
jgi:hypothetical protein